METPTKEMLELYASYNMHIFIGLAVCVAIMALLGCHLSTRLSSLLAKHTLFSSDLTALAYYLTFILATVCYIAAIIFAFTAGDAYLAWMYPAEFFPFDGK